MPVRRPASAVSSPGSGASFGQFLRGMAQPIGFAPGPLDLGAVARDLLLGGAAHRPQPRDLDGLGFEAAIGVEQPAMGCGIDQRAVVVLAVDLDQRGADGAQHLHRHRLVVEEGAGAAVGELDPAQNQLVFGRNVVGGEYRPRRMIHRHVEGRRHLPLLGTLAHQAGIAAAAERQRERIEQDRFAGTGLAGQHRKARREIDIEAVDQDDVSDREPGQHRSPRCRRVYARPNVRIRCSHRAAKHSTGARRPWGSFAPSPRAPTWVNDP